MSRTQFIYGFMHISIITATYNAAQYLQHLIDSIKLSKTHEVEFIIIDGNSIDNTLDIIKNNNAFIDYWQSEPDKGIYDAWNKGVLKAKGDWVMFLGADDELLPNALQQYLDILKSVPDIKNYDIISSKVQMIDNTGKLIRIRGWAFEWPLFLKEMTIAHPGALHSKKYFNQYGLFDINYRIVGDYELLLRAGSQLKAFFIDKITVKMREGGMSDSTKAIWEHYQAVIHTKHTTKFNTFLNACLVTFKFKIKKYMRSLGVNIYLKY